MFKAFNVWISNVIVCEILYSFQWVDKLVEIFFKTSISIVIFSKESL